MEKFVFSTLSSLGKIEETERRKADRKWTKQPGSNFRRFAHPLRLPYCPQCGEGCPGTSQTNVQISAQASLILFG